MKKLLTFLAVLAVAALAIIEEWRIANLHGELAAARQPSPPATASEARPGTPQRPDRAPTAPTRETQAERPAKPATMPPRDASLRKIIENPVARAAMNQGQKAMVATWYADLIREFDLNQTEADHFANLLAGSLMEQQDFGMQLMGAKDEAERRKLADELTSKHQQREESIREFLNNEQDFATYQNYAERLPELQQLEPIRAAMRAAQTDIAPEQTQVLLEAMYRARVTLMADGSVQSYSPFAPDAEQRFEQNWGTFQAALRKEVSPVLDTPQLEAFFRYQATLKEMQLISLQMSRKLLEEQANPAPAGNEP